MISHDISKDLATIYAIFLKDCVDVYKMHTWQERPEILIDKIDKTFKVIASDQSSNWGRYNGSSTYRMVSLREWKCIKTMMQKAPKEQKEFYILDIGAGNFQFVQEIVRYINDQEDLPNAITVHVIGIRGEKNENEEQIQIGKCKLYEFGAFKVEELFEEFLKRGLYLNNKIDFVISHWSIRHLCDPVGTFVRIYNLLRSGGFFVADEFSFLGKSETTDYYESKRSIMDLLVRIKAPFLIDSCSDTQFILQRPDNTPCQLEWNYLNFENVDWSSHNSNCITRFDKEYLIKRDYFPDPSKFFEDSSIEISPRRYCLNGNHNLYSWLRKNRIIDLDTLCVGIAHEQYELHSATKEGNVQKIKELLAMGYDIDESDTLGYSPLHIAMKHQQLDCFKFLLVNGADPELPSAFTRIRITKELAYFDSKNEIYPTLLEEAETMGYRRNYYEILDNSLHPHCDSYSLPNGHTFTYAGQFFKYDATEVTQFLP